MEIHPSARKHGIADEDIEHATRHALAIDDQDDARLYSEPSLRTIVTTSSRSALRGRTQVAAA